MKHREIYGGQEQTADTESLTMERGEESNGHELEALIHSLTIEKDRYKQEKLAQRISGVKLERTAEFVAELFYSEDAYIRNLAIELLIALGEKALPALKVKINDEDRNIRKFALDALKFINGECSCVIAVEALKDPDENVVEAALEVIAQQKYEAAESSLLHILNDTKSIWVMNSLIRTFEKLGIHKAAEAIADKIFTMKVFDVEKNILMNTYVKALGAIGSYSDLKRILKNYSKEYSIDDNNLVFGLSNLIVNNKIYSLPEDDLAELEKIFKVHWDYRTSEHILISIAALVQLQLDFFLDNMKKIYEFNKNEEFFSENLGELLLGLTYVPSTFIKEVLECKEPALIMLGLRLIYHKGIAGFNSIIEELCKSSDREIASQAIGIVAEFKAYHNPLLLESLSDYSDEAEIASVESRCASGEQDLEFLFIKLEHPNRKVRKAVAEKLVQRKEEVNLELLEEIVWRNQDEVGMEALEVLFRLDNEIGWKQLNTRLDSIHEGVRVGLISIIENSSEEEFYGYMNTMINDPSCAVRKKAIKALSKKGDDRSFALLEKLYHNESNTGNRADIIASLHKYHNVIAFELLVAAANSQDVLTRIAAIRSLGLLHNSKADIVLKCLLEDPVEEVMEAAKEALMRTKVVNK